MSVIAEVPVSDLQAAGTIFAALGRTLLCLDAACNIKYCSSPLARPGQPAADLLGDELFGPLGALRQVLDQGETREGWRAVLRGVDGPAKQVSLAAAPCDVDGIRYIVTMQPAEDDVFLGSSAPVFFFGVVARSAAMLDIITLLESVRTTDAPVFLCGEDGTGKKTLARALHAASARRGGRFVPIDCAAVSPELISLDIARGGTLYLGHICKLSLTAQAKLLPLLEANERDVRIIAACKTDVRRHVEAGTFREDLARLLRTIPIDVPPLRLRGEDIEPLAQHLLARVAARHGCTLRFAPDAVRVLLRHTWPGNVRELETVVEHGAVIANSQTVQPGDLPPDILRAYDDPRFRATDHGELQQIRGALDAHHWNREATARALGMSRTTLWRKMRELRLV